MVTFADLQSESQFQKSVIEYARWKGWRVAHFPDSRHVQGNAGLPDLVMAREGKVILAELKSESGKLREGQKEWLTACGFHGYLWRPSDWDAIESVLD